MSFIEKAQEILSEIEGNCQSILDIDSSVDLMDFDGFKLSSSDIVSYENLISKFLENIMNVEVQDLINEGFLCNHSTCATEFFMEKKRVIGFMFHIIQDITLFRNKLQIKEYVDLFSLILKRQLSQHMIKSVSKELKDLNSLKNRFNGLLKKKDTDILMTEALEKNINSTENFIKDKENEIQTWKDNRAEDGKEANKIKVIISDHKFMESKIMASVLSKPVEIKKDIILSLRKVVYLRNIDNLCNSILKRSEGIPELDVQKSIDSHNEWILVLESAIEKINILINIEGILTEGIL